jgi:ubiquitin C-terminal hydrolase
MSYLLFKTLKMCVCVCKTVILSCLYGCQKRSLTFQQEYKLQMSENKMARHMRGLMKRVLSILHNVEHCHLHKHLTEFA